MTLRTSELERLRVRDAMHTGILTTDPSTPLRVVARLMAERRVHAVAVADPGHARRPWGVVDSLDIVAAAVTVPTVKPDAPGGLSIRSTSSPRLRAGRQARRATLPQARLSPSAPTTRSSTRLSL
jgi:hypothetical protein